MYISLSSIFSILSRLVCVGFLVTAGITIPEIWKLTDSAYEKSADGSTVFIPLEMCTPPSVSVDGLAVIFDGEEVGMCHSLMYMIGACAAALILAGSAMLLFFFFDFVSGCGCKQISTSSLFGMSLFLTFSLIQAAASCFALYEECGKREDYFLKMFRDTGDSTITSVKMQGARIWFFVTMITALSAAGVLLLESLALLCCGDNNKQQHTPSEQAPVRPASKTPTATSTKPDDQSQGVSTSAETQQISNVRESTNSPPWAQP